MGLPIVTGLERIALGEDLCIPEPAGLICNQASVDSRGVHALDIFRGRGFDIGAIFGPQHGPAGTDPANMVEWSGGVDSRTGLPLFSLYGEHRRPTPEMLENLASLVCDLQSVGSRYYTYIWTALLSLRSAREAGIPFIVLDRPNPIGGLSIEGPPVSAKFESFVGLADIPIRHGLTPGELLLLLAHREGLEDSTRVIEMKGWRREMLWEDTGLPWIYPSPNMPSPKTALVYPGGCLLEGTNLSEGRGTTLPFELVGAPWADGYDLAAALDAESLPGVAFRPAGFQPRWDKFAGRFCNGVQIIPLDNAEFRPFYTYCAIIRACRELFPDEFRWLKPPYEYEYELPPIDILYGSDELRKTVDSGGEIAGLRGGWAENERKFSIEREPHLLY